MKEKKSEKSKMHRRCFLSGCAKYAIGVSLLGYGMNSFGDTNDSYLDYSYCIYKCPGPCSYDTACVGCRDDNTGARLTCTVRNCVIEKGLPSCAHCDKLATCDKELYVNYPGQRNYALNKQTQWGLLAGAGIAGVKEQIYKVFPNSTPNGFTIYSAEPLSADFIILNIHGSIVKSGRIASKKHYVDISYLSSGSYVLSIKKNQKLLFTSKIMKE